MLASTLGAGDDLDDEGVDVQPMSGLWTAASVGALTGAIVTSRLTVYGIGRLTRSRAVHRGLRPLSSGAGCAAGIVAIEAARHAGTWSVVPALLLWACALAAAACSDAVTQRIPTPLVRQVGIVTCLLLAVGLAVHGDWRGLLFSVAAAATSGLTLLLCWRLAGAGFGDVRLATLGGLGLGHTTVRGLAIAVIASCSLLLVQTVVTSIRSGDRRARLPLGPALTLGFLLAAAL